MNFLCHFHLAGDDTGLIIGGLLGDHIKGPLKGNWPADWEQGIKLHRHIDSLTDNHPAAKTFIETLPKHYRRFAPIMLDVCFDYCLAQQWSDYHPAPLPSFAQEVYQIFEQSSHALPQKAANHSARLAEFDVLSGSKDWALIARMLTAIDARFKKPTPLTECEATLKNRLNEIQSIFTEIYADLDQQLLNYRPSVIRGNLHGRH